MEMGGFCQHIHSHKDALKTFQKLLPFIQSDLVLNISLLFSVCALVRVGDVQEEVLLMVLLNNMQEISYPQRLAYSSELNSVEK